MFLLSFITVKSYLGFYTTFNKTTPFKRLSEENATQQSKQNSKTKNKFQSIK